MGSAGFVLFSSIACVLLAACVQNAEPGIEPTHNHPTFNNLTLFNETRREVNNVHLEVTQTHRFVDCNRILPLTSCSLSFPPQPVRQDAATLSWEHRGERYTHVLRADPPAPGARSPLMILVKIQNDGELSAQYVGADDRYHGY